MRMDAVDAIALKKWIRGQERAAALPRKRRSTESLITEVGTLLEFAWDVVNSPANLERHDREAQQARDVWDRLRRSGSPIHSPRLSKKSRRSSVR